MSSPHGELPVAKAEYFFVSENYRTERVRGFANSFKPPALILLEQLYRRGLELGWGPLIISAPKQIEPLHRMAGCRPLPVALRECLLILRPWRAAKATPNLKPLQRAVLFLAGTGQQMLWFILSSFMPRTSVAEIEAVSPSAKTADRNGSGALSFSESDDFLAWRYPAGEYFRLAFGPDQDNYAILKKGSHAAYLRVCQSRITSQDSFLPVLAALRIRAAKDGALGVRWAVYENGSGELESRLVRQMRKLGFVCAPRVRNLWVYSPAAEFLRPQQWQLSDSLFSFDN
ncbi:MAG: hypothetical protein ACRD5F_08645 [Candidatus Acidiferrales bacterium]